MNPLYPHKQDHLMPQVKTPDNGIALYTIKSVYGQDKAYPANSLAEALCDMTNTKTMLYRHISIIKRLGFDVQFITPSVQDFDPTTLQ